MAIHDESVEKRAESNIETNVNTDKLIITEVKKQLGIRVWFRNAMLIKHSVRYPLLSADNLVLTNKGMFTEVIDIGNESIPLSNIINLLSSPLRTKLLDNKIEVRLSDVGEYYTPNPINQTGYVKNLIIVVDLHIRNNINAPYATKHKDQLYIYTWLELDK